MRGILVETAPQVKMDQKIQCSLNNTTKQNMSMSSVCALLVYKSSFLIFGFFFDFFFVFSVALLSYAKQTMSVRQLSQVKKSEFGIAQPSYLNTGASSLRKVISDELLSGLSPFVTQILCKIFHQI